VRWSRTGSAPEQGKDACYVAPLEAGHYIVTVDGAPDEQGQPAQLEARVRVDKRSIPHVQFVFGAPAAAPHASSIRGRVTGLSAGAPVTVALVDAQAQRQERQTDAAGHFAFDDLAAGLYTVSAAGAESAAEIALDGHNQVTVELSLPAQQPVRAAPAPAAAAAASFVRGVAPDATGGVARLLDAVGNERRAAIDATGHFAFDALPAGVYALFAEGGYVQRDLHLDGAGGVEVTFAPLLTVWETVTANAGSMPGYGAVRVEVEGMRNLPVRLWQGEDEGQVLKTGSAPVLGEFAVEFAPLAAGLYVVEPEGIGRLGLGGTERAGGDVGELPAAHGAAGQQPGAAGGHARRERRAGSKLTPARRRTCGQRSRRLSLCRGAGQRRRRPARTAAACGGAAAGNRQRPGGGGAGAAGAAVGRRGGHPLGTGVPAARGHGGAGRAATWRKIHLCAGA
jgi:hypothetical protein